jgi:hypothetical protein
MDIQIPTTDADFDINPLILQKMAFVFNALEDGWAIKKKKNLYIFSKHHEGKKEVYLDDYLKRFMKQNFNINNLLDADKNK